ncbi:DUF4625 domain-containing protein [Flammeovirga sp. EKP202]|uniref:DUF4625 domain-containing protein n=1 Tax=Flammeovirga sp. EKP202 TaxID=2770592 RepID=UPI00165FDC72|nr:DUF4625 domain-containing protein [Flammeovirga sp. EKP202]MBD0404282.1 DUF4625 domain-containing protein [Flammeovirga sp. EKP202]
MKKNFVLISLLLIGLFSCDNDTDEQGPLPTISNYTVEGEHDHGSHERSLDEGEETELEMGGEAHIDAELAGQNLKTVLLDIHWGEGHTHDRVQSVEDSVQWTEKIEWNFGVEGGLTPEGIFPSNHDFHQHIDVPSEIDGKPVKEGEYHFVLFLWDQDGNETQQALTVHVHAHEEEEEL